MARIHYQTGIAYPAEHRYLWSATRRRYSLGFISVVPELLLFGSRSPEQTRFDASPFRRRGASKARRRKPSQAQEPHIVAWHFSRGMESVIVTVSGYHGVERFNLIKLISCTGASYVGSLTKSNTHLVCWELEGKKFELATTLGTIVISHKWFEDCLKEGRRLPEDPYTMKCGKDVGKLSWTPENLDCSMKKNIKARRETKKPLNDLSNGFLFSDSQELSPFSEDVGWSISHLLDEQPGSTSSRPFKGHKRGRFSVTESSCDSGRAASRSRRLVKKHDINNDNVDCARSRQLAKRQDFNNDNVDCEGKYYSMESSDGGMHSVGLSTFRSVGSSLDGRYMPRRLRLQEENNSNEHVHHVEGGCLTASHFANTSESTSRECNVNGQRDDSSLSAPIPSFYWDVSEDGLVDSRENQHEADEFGSVCGPTTTMIDQSVSRGNQVVATGRPMQDSYQCIDPELTEEKVAEKTDVKNLDKQNSIQASELSCVICFTEFSSERAVLSCGHRFCYSCIQDWADRLIADRKTPTCPLCKASFRRIKRLDDSTFYDQKIYSQSVSCSISFEDISVVPDREDCPIGTVISEAICLECHLHEPEDLLTSCHICNNRWVHSCCLDPPLVPWTCIHCRDLRTLYRLYR